MRPQCLCPPEAKLRFSPDFLSNKGKIETTQGFFARFSSISTQIVVKKILRPYAERRGALHAMRPQCLCPSEAKLRFFPDFLCNKGKMESTQGFFAQFSSIPSQNGVKKILRPYAERRGALYAMRPQYLCSP